MSKFSAGARGLPLLSPSREPWSVFAKAIKEFLPTPFLHTLSGYLPDASTGPSIVPHFIIFAFLILTFRPLFSIEYVEKITAILTNPSFLLKFSTTRFRYVSAYYQVMFYTDEQFLFYNFIMILKGNKLTRFTYLFSKLK